MRLIAYLVHERFGSLRKFASICDIPDCTMHHYFTGLRFPNTHNFMTIARKLNVTAEYLYDNWYKEVKVDD